MDPASETNELLSQRDFLRRLARGLLGDEALAEDVVQEAELRALERRPAGNLRAWLATVTRRLALNARRGRGRRAAHERAAARDEAVSGPDEVLEGLDLQRGVLEAVRALAEAQRTVVWLRYYEDRSPGEIAERLAVPVATVKTRLRRALAALRERLDAANGGERRAWAAALVPLARRSTPGPSGAGPGIVGGMLAMKKLVAALAVLALVLLTWRAVATRASGPSAAAQVVAVRTGEVSAPHEPVAEPEPRSVAARESLASGNEGAGRELASAGATLVVHAVFERDGTDAAGIQLAVIPQPRSDLRVARAATDAGGRARFEGLAPGAFSVHTDRAGMTEIELAAGAVEELELVIAAGVDVTGVVVDRAGAPVAGAEIWLSRVSRFTGDGWLSGEVVARADSEGSFFLRSVGPRQSVGAFARGFAPALLEELREKSWPADDARVELTLVLEREGAALEGRVLDPLGIPVPDALVACGYAGMDEVPGADGRFGSSPTARAMRTDELGRFRADGLAPGPIPVFVLAQGFALVRQDATVSAGETEHVTVPLARGATIAGRVLDPAGQPLSGARVTTQKAGAIDGACPFSLPETTSSAEGTFQLDSVPAGEITLTARHPFDIRMKTRAARVLAEGATETWDLILETAPSIRGRAVDGEGRGLAHWGFFAGSGPVGMSSETDDEGRFVIVVRDPAEVWTLQLMHDGVVHDRAENVRAGDEVVLVSLDPRELGRVEGGFADAAGRVPDGARISASLVAEVPGYRAPVDLVEGRFVFAGARPGRYTVRIQSADLLLAESDTFEVLPGATLDLGLLTSRAPGSLVVEYTLPPGFELPDGCAYVYTGANARRVLVRRDGEWRADELDPGRGSLFTFAPGMAQQSCSFEVQEGRETRLSVVLERGVERTLVFEPAPGATCQSAEVLLRSSSWELSLPAIGGDRLALSLMLAPGVYQVEATTNTGLTARGELVIPDLALAHAEVAFELR